MSANPTPRFVSLEEYLEQQDRGEFRSEYFNGEIFPIYGATTTHSAIAVNVLLKLKLGPKSKPWQVFESSLVVQVSSTGLYTHPDVTVVCGDIRYAEGRKDVVTNPTLIVEVLSPSTEDYDRGTKFELYRTIPALVDYLTIAQEKVHVAHWSRQTEHQGLLVDYVDLEQKIELTSVGCVLALADIYDGIEWPKEGA